MKLSAVKKILAVLFILMNLSLLVGKIENAQAQTNDDRQQAVQESRVARVETGQGALQFETGGGIIYDGLTSIGGTVASLSGKLFDLSLSYFVLDMAGTVKSFGLDILIKNTWSLIRDIFNLLFIFGLIFIGFQILLENNDSQAKRNLGSLVIAALLINFSLYAAQLVIDFGNIATAELRQSLVTSESTYKSTVFGIEIFNISSGFIAATDLRELPNSTLELSSEQATGEFVPPTSQLTIGHALALGLTVALMLMVVGFVLAAGAFLMITRFFYLVYLMMISPIMFLGWILPKFKNYSSNWWRQLFNQTLIGPVYILMLIIALRALETMQSSQLQRELNTMNFLLSAIMISGFAWGALIVSHKFGAYGAKYAMDLGEGWGKTIRGTTTAFMGRNTVGWASNWAQKKFTSWQEKPEEKQSGGGKLARRFFAATDLDRGIIGATDKGKAAKFAGSKSFNDAQKIDEERKKRLVTGARAQRTETIKQGGEAAESAVINVANEQLIDLLQKNKINSPEWNTVVSSMSNAQYETIMKLSSEDITDELRAQIQKKRGLLSGIINEGGGINNASDVQLKALGVQEIAANAGDLNQSQFDKIMNSKAYNDTEKNTIKQARENKLWDRFTSSKEEVFEGLKDSEIAKLPEKILTHIEATEHLTPKSLSKILEDETVTPGARKTIKNNIKDKLLDGKTDSLREFLETPLGKQF